jgi:hypothetical protein
MALNPDHPSWVDLAFLFHRHNHFSPLSISFLQSFGYYIDRITHLSPSFALEGQHLRAGILSILSTNVSLCYMQ